jgi:hypothetical protein
MNKDTIWGVVIGGLITFICSFFFFHLSVAKREPVYTIIKSPSIIYDKTNSSPRIKILVDDSLSISENIYVTTIALWNKGKLPINHEDIRKDIFLYCLDKRQQTKILDVKIIEQNDPQISNFRVIPLNRNTLQILWDYFDPNYGCKIQVIYSGNENTRMVIAGTVLDTDVKEVNINFYNSKKELLKEIIFLVLNLLAVSFLWFNLNRNRNSRYFRWMKISTIILTILSLLAIVYSAVVFWDSIFPDKVPF